MRLTLRTMLAYMDDILEPEDHQDIGRKIEESEFANGLLHRIRDVSRRMRLAAPKVAGRGMGLDPNTVAEYLDNTLPGERVPDFEKVCLESDIHLAEVASCHQILTLVLGEAAEVDPALRNRMYELVARADEPEAGERRTAAVGASAADGGERTNEPVTPTRPRPEVPDYLRSGSRRGGFWPIAITALLAIVLVAAIIKASGVDLLQLAGIGGKGAGDSSQHDRTNNSTGKPDQASPAASTSTVSTSGAGANDKSGDHDAKPAGSTDKGPPPADAKASGTAEQTGGELPAKPVPTESDTSKGSAAPEKSGLSQPGAESPTAAAPDSKRPAVPPPPVPDTGSTSPAPMPPVSVPRPDDASAVKPAVNIAPQNTVPQNSVPPNVASTSPFDLGDQRIGGRWIPDQEVLLRMAAGQTEWHRVAPGVTFSSGDKLLALPTFRPTVTLAAGITLRLVPETLIEFAGADHGVPVVRVHYGRMVMMTTGKADVRIKLALGDWGGTINFDDADATTAVEVQPYNLPGTDPEKSQSQRAIALYGINGDVSWVPSVGNLEKLHAPARLVLAAGPALQATDRELPKWISAEPLGVVDLGATQALNVALDEQRPVTQALLELSGHRRQENRSLAARSLALIGEFEPFDKLLNDRDERPLWATQIESLKAALARGPAVAAKVRAMFEEQRGKDGTELYRMLWGYGKDDLAAGAANKLVEYLDYDNLDLRVLSFYNLRTLSGKTLDYYPEATTANRQSAVRRWKDRIKDGLLGPKAPSPAKPAALEPTPSKTAPPPPEPGNP
ncbi:MAG TPA: hypothetical protein VG056_05870 [Pirellulales bacterium]|jgi:hypothetical protein|nr:hypothetical protein [Pirellulales bacterium]